ncbi:unnamed protein product, partial [Amoebophrya sp. A25]
QQATTSAVKASSSSSTSASGRASVLGPPKELRPFMLQFLARSKQPSALGVIQYSENGPLPPGNSIEDLLGVSLSWDDFPLVRVTSVDTDSRAKKERVVAGDYMITIGAKDDRITLVSQWAGASAEDAVVQKLRSREKRGEKPCFTVSFARKKYADKYFLQMDIERGPSSGNEDLG